MKKVVLGFVILLLVVGIIPLHELGHIIGAKVIGGKIIDIDWLNLTIDPPSHWLPYLAGGQFQSLIYASLGFIFSTRKNKAFKVISLACLFLGIVGIVMGVLELWIWNKVPLPG